MRISPSTASILGTDPTLDALLSYLQTTKEELLELNNLCRLAHANATVVLSGSLAEGLGNCRSDIDLLVLGDISPSVLFDESAEMGQESNPEFQHSMHLSGKRRVDIAMVGSAVVSEAAETLQSRPNVRPLSGAQRVIVHRLRVGKPLLNEQVWNDFVKSFPYDAFLRFLQEEAIAELDSDLEDMYGMMEDEDVDTALLACQRMLNTAYCAYSHKLGSTNPNPKWSLRLLKRFPEDRRAQELVDRFWDLFFPDVSKLKDSPEAAYQHFKGAIKTSNTIADWIQEGW